MASKTIVFGFAFFLQAISAQVIGNAFAPGIAANALVAESAALAGGLGIGAPLAPNLGYPANGFSAANALALDAVPGPLPGCGFGLSLSGLSANGGGFTVTSSSPIAPNGVSVQSENLVFEGPLAVTGQMPFLGAVALEGPLPAAGQGAVAYGCGNGNIGIVSEDVGPSVGPAGPLAGPYGPNPGLPGFGYGLGPAAPCY